MSQNRLSKTAIIIEVISMLDDADQYVANVRHRMTKAQAEIGPVAVRIGITGKGRRQPTKSNRLMGLRRRERSMAKLTSHSLGLS